MAPNKNYITWTRPKLERFKQAYQSAKATGEVIGHDPETFTFEGNEFVPGYAKYLIEYLELQFKPDTRNVETPI
jgi:hypothetical protein